MIHAAQRVLTARGMVPVGELMEGTSKLLVARRSRPHVRLGETPITKIERSQASVIMRVVLQTGHELLAGADTEVYVAPEDAQRKKRRVGQLDVGDRIFLIVDGVEVVSPVEVIQASANETAPTIAFHTKDRSFYAVGTENGGILCRA